MRVVWVVVLLSMSVTVLFGCLGSSEEPTPTPVVIDCSPDDLISFAFSPSFQDDGAIYVGTDPCGVFRSFDYGDTWSQSNQGLIDGVVTDVVMSTNFSNDNTVFISTVRNGVFRSTNKGDLWEQTSRGLERRSVAAIAISPDYASDRTLFAGTQFRGIFRSSNGGDSWEQVGLPSSNVLAIGISPEYATDRTVIAGTGRNGVFRSVDGGESWEEINRGLGTFERGGATVVRFSPGLCSRPDRLPRNQGGRTVQVDERRQLLAARRRGTHEPEDRGARHIAELPTRRSRFHGLAQR